VDVKLGDGKLPPFIGYLPPVVDGVLLELQNMSHPDYPPRRGRTGAQLSQDRKLAIASVEEHFRERPHERAIEIMARSMKQHKPYCLYLRNFGLGPRVYHARNDPFGLPQVMTLMSTQFDVDLQRLIGTAVSPAVPALSIRNPAGTTGTLPAFIVSDDEWAELAQTLVRNAGLIIMYYLSLTSGVAEELTLIRREGKQAATLIVLEKGDPFDASKDLATLFEVQRQEPETVAGNIDDFPHQVTHRKEDGWSVVEAKLREMSAMELSPPVEPRIGLPVEYMPPAELLKFCTDQATREYDQAHRLMEEQRYEEAEDVLTRAIAFTYWGRDRLGQAMTLTALAQLNLLGFKAKGDAGAYFEMALEVCEDIRATSPTAAQLYPHIEQALKQLRAEADEKAKAKRQAAGSGDGQGN
jgi:hypothetical protein